MKPHPCSATSPRIHFILALVIGVLILTNSCTKSRPGSPVLARIGDRVITVDEFRSRIELSLHPEYPALDESAKKRLLLKNLIAEKCIAMETGEDNALAQKESFRDHIQGIREQAMREVLYNRKAWDQVQIDHEQIDKIYPLAGRTYHLAFHTIQDARRANALRTDLYTIDPADRSGFFDLFTKNAKLPTRDITFRERENPVIHDALFTRPLDVGEVIGPLQIEENSFLVMKVLDWTDQPAIGTGETQIRWRQTEEVLHRQAAGKIWAEYKQEVMRGKELYFEKEPFREIADYILRELNEAKQEEGSVSDSPDSRPDEVVFREDFLKSAFFTIGDRVWTVEDFQKMLRVHPLVYRKKHFETHAEFLTQLKYAIANLVADVHLTQEAYQAGLDRTAEVKIRESMWRDALIGSYQVHEIVKSFPNRKDFDPRKMQGGGNHLEFYVDELMNKYKDRIAVDLTALESAPLTRSSLFAVQQNVPYPVPVPAFPDYTSGGDLIYGKTLD